jgi:hypothetical protein
MSLPDLPDDPARWPTDPYALLGIQPGVLPRDLRRAYTQLIRRYKPEQYPEHFRRIRAAYEAVLFFTDGQAPFANGSFPHPPLSFPEPPAQNHSFPTALSLESEVRQAWELACSDGEEEAYHRLRRLESRHPGNGDLCARLYWLLTLDPSLDPLRSRFDWLAQGLRASELAGPLGELYRRELAANPAEALHERYARLLHVPSPAGRVVDFVDWRWQAAAKLGKATDVVGDDLEDLRGRFPLQDEESWARLLLLAVQRLAWDDSAAAQRDECKRELNQSVHLHRHLGPELDWLDHLEELSADWQALRGKPDVPAGLLELVPRSWDRPLDEFRPALQQFLGEVAAAPRRYLAAFDRVWRRGPAVLTEFGRLLILYQSELDLPPERRSAISLTELLLECVDLADWQDYISFRRALLDFCVREELSPEWAGQALAERTTYWLPDRRHLSQAILDDWPLRYVCLAQRLFWA